MTPQTLQTVDWQTALYILSLDFIRPVYDDLGVQIRDRETLKSLARGALTGLLADQVSSSQTSTSEDFYSAHVAPFLVATSRAFGPSGIQRVEYWVAYTVCTEGHNPWSLYEHILSSWAAIYRKTNRDEIGFSTNPARIATEVKRAGDLSVAERTLQEQRGKILTNWDLSVFSKLGLLEIPEGSDFFPLIDAIELTIRMHKFHMFWSWLLSLIGPDDLGAVASYAKHRAGKRIYVPPGDLPLPVSRP